MSRALRLATPELLYCCDPVLGDRDRGLFVHVDIPPLVRDRLCPIAGIITPNHFEFEYLGGAKAATIDRVIEAARALMARGPSTVVVTSAELADTPEGEIETLAVERSKAWRVRTPKLPISPSGKGDLFAALLMSARVRGADTPDALSHAASAIFAVLERTAIGGTEEMRIVESGDLLVHPKRRHWAFINIKFSLNVPGRACGCNHRIRFLLSTNIFVKGKPMRKAAVVFSAAALLTITAVSVPKPAEAGGGWGWGPGIAGGLIAGAIIGGIASSAYAYGPGYGYYGGYAPGYYGGYAPSYYGGYAPAYYGYGYRRPYVYRRAYYRPYYGPRFYGAWGGW